MTKFLIPVTIEFDATVMVKTETQEEGEKKKKKNDFTF